jgi:hypothetical protein
MISRDENPEATGAALPRSGELQGQSIYDLHQRRGQIPSK